VHGQRVSPWTKKPTGGARCATGMGYSGWVAAKMRPPGARGLTSEFTPGTTPAPALSPQVRPTRAGVHRGRQGEVGGKGEGAQGSANGDHLVLRGLARLASAR